MPLSEQETARVKTQLAIARVHISPNIKMQIYSLLRNGEPPEDSYRGALLAGYRNILAERQET